LTRSTSEVIQDLDNAGTNRDARYDQVAIALVIGFEQGCKLIFHGDPDRLPRLNAMVRDGGKPLGLVKVIKKGNEMSFLSKTLIEYKDDPEVAGYLTTFCSVMGKQIVSGSRGS